MYKLFETLDFQHSKCRYFTYNRLLTDGVKLGRTVSKSPIIPCFPSSVGESDELIQTLNRTTHPQTDFDAVLDRKTRSASALPTMTQIQNTMRLDRHWTLLSSSLGPPNIILNTSVGLWK